MLIGICQTCQSMEKISHDDIENYTNKKIKAVNSGKNKSFHEKKKTSSHAYYTTWLSAEQYLYCHNDVNADFK